MPTSIQVSSKENINITILESMIESKVNHLLNQAESPFLLNKRQFNLILDLEKKLLEIKQLLVEPIPYEILSHHVQEALAHMTELTGKTISEQGMDAIFREFCIGK